MRIYPRSLELPEDVGGTVYLNNSSASGRILLFKIKRSDPKVVDFSPKRGYVEPESTLKVDIKFCPDSECTHAKVLVQLVAVHRSDFKGGNHFDHDWTMGMEGGMVKKIIEVRRQGPNNEEKDGDVKPAKVDRGKDDGEDGSVSAISDGDGGQIKRHRSPAGTLKHRRTVADTPDGGDHPPEGNPGGADNMSDFLGTAETSMISSFVAEKSLKYGSNITKEKSFRINPLPYNKLAATSTSHFMESSSNPQISGALKNSSPTATNIKKQPQHLHGTEIVSPIKGSPVVQSSSGITAGIRSHGGVAGLGNLYKTSALPITMSDDALLKYLERKGLKAQQQRLDSRRSYTSSDAVAAMYSMLIPFNPNEFASIVPLRGTEALKAREKIFVGQTFEESDAVMILQGEDVTDDIALRCIEARMDESMRQRRRVVGIAIKHCRIHTLDESLGCVFPVVNASSSSANTHANDVIDKANASMGFLLEANLRHILVNSGNLQVLDPTINRFEKLLTLDLSRNEIVKIVGSLELPHLVSLDLSNNILSTVDFLEQLRSLRFLDLSFNCITTLEGSVNMLIPLSKNIRRFNMSNNAVCRDERYVTRVLDILPRLTHFDGKDLQAMHARVHEQRIQRTQQSRSVSSSVSKKYAAPSSSSFHNNSNNSGYGLGNLSHSSALNRSSHLSTSRSASNGRGVIPGRQRPSSPHISTFPLSSTRSGGGGRGMVEGHGMVATGIDISRVRSSWTAHPHNNHSTAHPHPFNHSYTNEQPSSASATTGPNLTTDEFDLRLIRALRKRPYIGGWDSHNSNSQSNVHVNNSASNSLGHIHMNDVSFRGDIEHKASSSIADDVKAGRQHQLWKSKRPEPSVTSAMAPGGSAESKGGHDDHDDEVNSSWVAEAKQYVNLIDNATITHPLDIPKDDDEIGVLDGINRNAVGNGDNRRSGSGGGVSDAPLDARQASATSPSRVSGIPRAISSTSPSSFDRHHHQFPSTYHSAHSPGGNGNGSPGNRGSLQSNHRLNASGLGASASDMVNFGSSPARLQTHTRSHIPPTHDMMTRTSISIGHREAMDDVTEGDRSRGLGQEMPTIVAVNDVAQKELDRELVLQAQSVSLSNRQQTEKKQKQQTLIAAWAKETRHVQARHDRERYDRQHDDLDPTTTAGDDDMEGAYAGGNIIGEGVRVGRHGESILGSGGSGGDLGAADTDINAGNPMISRTSEYVHAVMSSSSRPLGESQGAGAGTSSSMFSSNANANANAIREETLNRSLGDFTTGGGNVSGGGMYHHTGAIETTTRRRASSVDRQPTHPSDRGVSESLLGPTALTLLRRKALGLSVGEEINESGERRRSMSSFEVGLDDSKFAEMQLDERHGKWHPRYRVPKEHFGFSQPFVHRRPPSASPSKNVPLFDQTVRRLREGFEMQPKHGTSSFGPPREFNKNGPTQFGLSPAEAMILNRGLQQLYKNVSITFVPPPSPPSPSIRHPSGSIASSLLSPHASSNHHQLELSAAQLSYLSSAQRNAQRKAQSLSPWRKDKQQSARSPLEVSPSRQRISTLASQPPFDIDHDAAAGLVDTAEPYTGYRKWYGDVRVDAFMKQGDGESKTDRTQDGKLRMDHGSLPSFASPTHASVIRTRINRGGVSGGQEEGGKLQSSHHQYFDRKEHSVVEAPDDMCDNDISYSDKLMMSLIRNYAGTGVNSSSPDDRDLNLFSLASSSSIAPSFRFNFDEHVMHTDLLEKVASQKGDKLASVSSRNSLAKEALRSLQSSQDFGMIQPVVGQGQGQGQGGPRMGPTTMTSTSNKDRIVGKGDSSPIRATASSQFPGQPMIVEGDQEQELDAYLTRMNSVHGDVDAMVWDVMNSSIGGEEPATGTHDKATNDSILEPKGSNIPVSFSVPEENEHLASLPPPVHPAIQAMKAEVPEQSSPWNAISNLLGPPTPSAKKGTSDSLNLMTEPKASIPPKRMSNLVPSPANDKETTVSAEGSWWDTFGSSKKEANESVNDVDEETMNSPSFAEIKGKFDRRPSPERFVGEWVKQRYQDPSKSSP